MHPPNTLGAYIRALRHQQRMTQRELACKCACTIRHILDIEHGDRFPSRELLDRLSLHLGESADELLRHDTRVPLAEIQARIAVDPQFAYALRALAAKRVSAARILELAGDL